MHFDPDAAAKPGSGIFGLPHLFDDAEIVLLPVPFDATTSYGNGTAHGPEAIFAASSQVDLFHRRFGKIYERGIHMLRPDERIARLSAEAREIAVPIIEKGGAEPGDEQDVARVNMASEEMNVFVYKQATSLLSAGKKIGLIGGDHSTPFGMIKALAEMHKDIGILQLDAHMDLRDAFEGFQWSHASIMHNVLSRIPGVSRLVQVGIRDFGLGEVEFARAHGSRCAVFYDEAMFEERAAGTPFDGLCKRIIDALPEKVHVSFDIDGLSPAYCPHTGTPVPGGLSFNEATYLLWKLKESGRRVVGFDLVEVCPSPSPDEPEWDANVGARMLYPMCGML
ncbi:MAG: agmatinase family protein [Phycisphaeraceae bacterium]|nr:MAG: agmatinase family protein [Phycisphaeraceae bacterium]